MSKNKFTTTDAIQRLMNSMEVAIDNMIEEVKKPVDPEINGSARKAELQSIKQTAVDCQDLIKKYQELIELQKELLDTGSMKAAIDFSGGFAERFSK